MNMNLTILRGRWPTLMLTLSLFVLSGCAAPPVIRGTSEVVKLRDGDTVRVPPDWEPRIMYGISPVALEELLRAAGKKTGE
jgi:hypothetical protein